MGRLDDRQFGDGQVEVFNGGRRQVDDVNYHGRGVIIAPMSNSLADQLLCSLFRRGPAIEQVENLRLAHKAVDPVRAQHQPVMREDIVRAVIDTDGFLGPDRTGNEGAAVWALRLVILGQEFELAGAQAVKPRIAGMETMQPSSLDDDAGKGGAHAFQVFVLLAFTVEPVIDAFQRPRRRLLR